MTLDEIDNVSCKHCGSYSGRFTPTPETVHYGKSVCYDCGGFIDWVKNPESNSRPASHKNLVNRFDLPYCEICLTPRELLPGRQVLEAHHIIPFKDGGTDERSNIMIVCTECHTLIEHRRTYKSHWWKS